MTGSERLSDAEVGELERLEKAATPGPWLLGTWGAQAEEKCECALKGKLLGKRAQDEYPGAGPYHIHESDFFPDEQRLSRSAPDCETVAGNYDYDEGGIARPEDARFIAAARNALPRLLAERAALRGALAPFVDPEAVATFEGNLDARIYTSVDAVARARALLAPQKETKTT